MFLYMYYVNFLAPSTNSAMVSSYSINAIAQSHCHYSTVFDIQLPMLPAFVSCKPFGGMPLIKKSACTGL